MQGTEYDAAGRATLRTLGSANPVQTRYSYYPWNASVDGGKLQQIYTTRGAAVLQNFQYDYDRNSNIETILDYVMGDPQTGIPQTQSFQYDNLDRLTSAGAADGTEGNYGPEGYSYDSATGNLAVKGSSSYNYGAQSAGCPDGALNKAHAAVAAGGNSYCYDPNGNMVRRTIGGVVYTLTYDAENHMTGYSGGTVSASFLYDGDGRRVQATVNGATTQFVGSHVEWQSSTSDMVRYYFAGGARVAMRTGNADLVWLVGDHLGSTNIAVYDTAGVDRQGYKAFGETRFGSLPTKYQYTGQRNEPELGLYYYGARWYDSSLARFSQADTIIPETQQGTIAWDRYAGINNNPVRFSDPSGHAALADGSMSKSPCFTIKTPDGKITSKTQDGKDCVYPSPPVSTQTPYPWTQPTWNGSNWITSVVTSGRAYMPFQAPIDGYESETISGPLNNQQRSTNSATQGLAAINGLLAPFALSSQIGNTPVNYVIYVQTASYGTFPLNGTTVIGISVVNGSAYPMVISAINIDANNQPSFLPCQQCNSVVTSPEVTVQPNSGYFQTIGASFSGQCAVVIVVVYQVAPITGSTNYFTASYSLP